MTVSDSGGNSTSVTSTGLTTTGTVSAATVSATNVNATNVTANSISANSLNLNGGQISGVGAGTAPDDAVNVAQLQAGLNRAHRQAASGASIAAAMSGLVFIPGKRFNFSMDVADYLGQGAVAANIGVLVTPNIALNAGVGTGFNYGGTIGRAGVTVGF